MYVVIFIAKIFEVSLMTVRTVLMTRGEKVYASIIGFFEVLIWLSVVSSVLSGIQEDPLRMFVYALGYGCGVFIGSVIEDKMAIGLVTVNIVVTDEESAILIEIFRDKNIGVTIIDAAGIDQNKKLLITHIKRKRKKELMKLIEESGVKAVVSISDVKSIYGGYGLKK